MKNYNFLSFLTLPLVLISGWVNGQVNVTFQVNMSNQTVSANGVHLAGSIQGWNASSTPMTDTDGDDVYEVTLSATANSSYQYRFINGDDFPQSEVVPQSCGTINEFQQYNRNLVLGNNDTLLSTVCFASCENCLPPVPQDTVNVTFKVNMAGVQVSTLGLHLAGNIQGWNPASTLMTDLDNDDIYEVTVPGIAGQTYQFKFINGNDWNVQESVPSACGVPNCCNGFDREITLDSSDVVFGPVCYGSCENCPTLPSQDTVNVTLKVNMNNQVISADGVHVAGSMQGWNASTTQMTDENNDGIYEYSFNAAASSQIQFKFVNGNSWSFGETVPSLCGVNSGNGTFNRLINLDSLDVVYGPVCFGECENCLDSTQSDGVVLVTFKVNMAGINVNANGVHLAGSIQGWNPSSTEMLDADGDGIYEVTLSAQAGTTHQFKFINGNDWQQSELVPSSCGVSDSYGGFNREIVLGNADFTFGPLCFGMCMNCEAPEYVDVTFQVNMVGQMIQPAGVHVAGSFQGWNPSASMMSDSNGDGVYELTWPVPVNSTFEYKYINGNDWPGVEAVPQNCGVDDGNGGFNRELVVDSVDVLLSPVCFSSCDICQSQDSVEITFAVNMQNEMVAAQGVFLRFDSSDVLIPMTLAQSSVYETTITLDAGTSFSYRFVNGLVDEAVQGICGVNSLRNVYTAFSNQVLPAVCYGTCADCGNNLITLQVNMREQQFSPGAVYVAGNFNDWILTPMMDADQDSVFSLGIQAGAFANLVYKFVNGSNWETVPQECGVSDGSNVNRVLETGEYDVEVAPVCFGGCVDCASNPAVPDTINVTFKVNMENELVSAEGVHLAGSIQGWIPSGTEMTDTDGDNIYEVTLPAAVGEVIEFKFINGIDWPESEAVPAQCGVSDNLGGFNRSMLPSANSNVFGPVCFSECVNCGDTLASGDSVSVTFLVNMMNVTVDPNGVHLAGNLQGWSPSTTEMTDLDADGIYEVILHAPVNSQLLFKFINGNDWPQAEIVPASCGADDGFGNYNRQLSVPTTDVVYGPICFAECADCNGGGGDGVEVTFQVNMANQTVSSAGVHVAGSMQGWDPAGTAMSDADGDGVYSVTLNVPVNSQINYKFINGSDWPAAELVPGACGVADGFGGFNRQYSTGNSAVNLPIVCFGECADCGSSVNVDVTFNVNMSNQTVSPLGVHLAGNLQGWDPTATEMLDIDGDGIYSVTLSVMANTNIVYKFINGNDWPASELVPAECGLDDGFGAFNRTFPVASSDINIQTVCFSGCTDCSSTGLVDVTFRVNIANIYLDSAGAYIAGSFNAFAPIAMMAESDSVYAYTATVAVNSLIQFKFLNGSTGWETVPFECGVDDLQGGYNRQISVDESNIQLNPICFATCTDCGTVNVDDDRVESPLITIYPNPTNGIIWIRREIGTTDKITLTDFMGRIVYSSLINGNLRRIEINQLPDGIYHLQVGESYTFKVVRF